MKPQHFIVLTLLALCLCLPWAVKAADDQSSYGDCNQMLTTFKRQCTLGPLTLTKGSLRNTYDCPCENEDAYCSPTGTCKINQAYTIHFTDVRSGVTFDGVEKIAVQTGLKINSLILNRYENGRLYPLNFSCKRDGSVNQGNTGINYWTCTMQTNCYDTVTDKNGVVRNRITGSLGIGKDCLTNGDYLLTACSGSYCANAISVTVANDLEASSVNSCKANGYQCGDLNFGWGKINCGTCADGQYCTNGGKCLVDNRDCGTRTCGFAGNIKPLKACGGTGVSGDFGDGKGGCLTNYTCSAQRCVWEGDCKTNTDCNKKALPSECVDINHDGIKEAAWNDVPYCLNKNCGHNVKPMLTDSETGLWYKNSASIYTTCKEGQECYIAGDNRAYCKNLPKVSTCACDNPAKACCTTCVAGPTTKCGGGIMATSYYAIPEPPTCVVTKTCSLKDFARDNFYKTPTPAGFLTGKNDYSYGIDNVKEVAKIDPDFTYHPAIAYCENLTANGFSDWYLPSKSELVSIFTNYFEKNKSKDTTRIYLDGAKDYAYYPFTTLMWGSYLTSQSYYGDIRNIWNVSFIHGTIAPTGYIPGGADNNTAAAFGSGIMCVRRLK